MNKENNVLVENFLNRTFFTSWKNQRYLKYFFEYGNYGELELQFSASCDQKCDYCYYAKYANELYPASIAKPEIVKNNLELVLNWLQKNQYYPRLSLFSGELFSSNFGFECLERIVHWYICNNIKTDIVIPTNFSFIKQDNKVSKMETILERAKKFGVDIFLSASVDGKFCDGGRPFRKQFERNDEYYDEIFQFCSKWKFMFHPMIYSKYIDKWIDNFLWFQENFEKHGIDWKFIYLLEVRNPEWSIKQLRDFYKFVRFIIRWSYEKSGISKSDFPKFVFDNRLFNIFTIFSEIGRGIGCSIQQMIQLRLGDLTTTLCHRNAYDSLNVFKFVVENNEIVGIDAINPSLLIATQSAKAKNFPFCEYCSIKDLCVGQCLGASYELYRNNFVPIPTVCALEHSKIAGILDELIELDLFNSFYEFYVSKRDMMKLYRQEWSK